MPRCNDTILSTVVVVVEERLFGCDGGRISCYQYMEEVRKGVAVCLPLTYVTKANGGMGNFFLEGKE
jgi:hypothetical protein